MQLRTLLSHLNKIQLKKFKILNKNQEMPNKSKDNKFNNIRLTRFQL